MKYFKFSKNFYLNKLFLICIIIIYFSNNFSFAQNNFCYLKYNLVKKNFFNEYKKKSIEDLEDIYKTNCNIGYFSEQLSIYLIYFYYKTNNFVNAKKIIHHFIKFNPKYKHIDYIFYIDGLIDMKYKTNSFFNLFYKNSQCDQKYMLKAFHRFIKINHHYQNSEYAYDATKKLIYIKNQLSEHNLNVVKFYFLNKMYISVVNRVIQMLKNFPDTLDTKKSLYYMSKSLNKLKINSLNDKIKKIILLNKE
ncbi:MAG: outer membrane protein assembly factor BamD [Enterobacterales bacterium]